MAEVLLLDTRGLLAAILTLDRRHFDVLRQLNGRAFRLWP